MLAALLATSSVLPAPIAPSAATPPVVVAGRSTANCLYGKLQRAAQLPTSRLGANPMAAVADRGQLSSLLWSSFAMSSVSSSDWIDRSELTRTRALQGSLLFLDATAGESAGGSLFGLFGSKKADTGTPALDVELLRFAAARGAAHAYVLLDGDDAAVGAAATACNEAISELESADTVLCTTIIAPVAGVALASSKGWVQNTGVQDHDGELSAPMSVFSGLGDEGQLLSVPAASGTMAREDFCELAVQCALRLGRDASEGAPPVRIVRASPAGGQLVERPLNTYDRVIAGPKGRARLGMVNSADWSALLAPFGVVKEPDPADWRMLRSVEIPAEEAPAEETA